MTSEKQIRANRRNSQKSTGPKTSKGKAVVKHNALKHGLLSQEVLLPNEDAATLEELGESLRAELKPVGEMENLLIERIVTSTWRLRRLGRVEAAMFVLDTYGMMTGQARQMDRVQDSEFTALGQNFAQDASMANAFSKLSRYETAIERSLYRALHELQRLQATRRNEGSAVQPPAAIDVDVSGIPEGNA